MAQPFDYFTFDLGWDRLSHSPWAAGPLAGYLTSRMAAGQNATIDTQEQRQPYVIKKGFIGF